MVLVSINAEDWSKMKITALLIYHTGCEDWATECQLSIIVPGSVSFSNFYSN